MSDVINPEHECPFDPKNYQCDCFIAPVGSFSWALIQLKLRKRVARSAWGDKGMYLAITPRVNDLTVEEGSAYAVDGVAVGTKYDYLTHIDLRNEHGNFVPWQPTQEDMMACDWGIDANTFDSKNYKFVLDVTPVEINKGILWGDHDGMKLVTLEDSISNNTISSFYWSGGDNNAIIANLNLRPDSDAESNLLKDIRDKKLTITVDGKKYELGYRFEKSDEPIYIPWYKGGEAEKIGNLLKQTGKTYHIQLNWHD
ncbi:DUF2829 domain-containing protein [Xenorhabdus bovienii]|uniref:DUF2829 domain-containing protein n=1 Tax=Xenorhabdus bovienii TaxID=40576 RepID=UPI0023B2180C|nr:DUF2829 domain-containing protein [Xenorhabdus bovienii]MDE9431343.1 DUF2829 domain-containing protein [Xenorhabdus bovienii]MDE9489219.1 DUF2829 domain-containing protein [Xenorhabdus bovienii]MDE9505335.1 DUF2829 domain-containing protein [Xenorhabdus bovienii]